MPKNLVLFSDGTGNSAAKLFKTNVWRLYQTVDLRDPQKPKEPRQFAFYDDGVGTSSFKPLAVLGGAFGVGLARNVRDLYVFLCRMYEPGDRIYAFGFSRGAFTIRVLVGLVMSQGLLRWHGDERELRRLAHYAYRAFRAERFHSRRNPAVGILRRLRDRWLGLWNNLRCATPYAQAERFGQPETPDAITIAFVGLWDTVDAYGLPMDELTRAIDDFIWPLTMPNYTLHKRVLRACHALALDDERNSFHPRLWDDLEDAIDPNQPRNDPDGKPVAPHIHNERISQVWFAGVHSNVGGGYPDDALAHVPLLWIMSEAEHCGLRFERLTSRLLCELSDENGPIYDSRRGIRGYYRYKPRRIERLLSTNKVSIASVKVHESVLRRIRAGHDGYAPIALPPGFAVVTINGHIIDGDAYVRSFTAAGGAPTGAQVPLAASTTPDVSLVGAASDYGRLREHVYNGVWWRRVAYFATLFLTLVLAVLPLAKPGNGACSGELCFLAAPIAALGKLLPSFATPWTDAFASHPNWFLPLAAAVAMGLWCGAWFDRRVHDHMRRLWYAIPALKPAGANVMAPAKPRSVERAVEWLRTRDAYHAVFWLLTHWVLPFVFLLSLAYAAVALFAQLTFSARSSFGAVCPDGVEAPAVWAGDQPLPFDTRRTCVSTGFPAKAGDTYRIRVTVPVSSRWWDRTLPAGPAGLECELPPSTSLLLTAGTPFRRHLAQPWFQLMARIGKTGNDSYALVGTPHMAPRTDRCQAPDGQAVPTYAAKPERGCPKSPPPPSHDDEVLVSTLVARTSGELFLYVNDGIELPVVGPWAYANNGGCGWVQVNRDVPAAGLKILSSSPPLADAGSRLSWSGVPAIRKPD